MKSAKDITFIVKFEDGNKVKMTAEEIAKLNDRRKYEVIDEKKGVVIMKKSFRGL